MKKIFKLNNNSCVSLVANKKIVDNICHCEIIVREPLVIHALYYNRLGYLKYDTLFIKNKYVKKIYEIINKYKGCEEIEIQ